MTDLNYAHLLRRPISENARRKPNQQSQARRAADDPNLCNGGQRGPCTDAALEVTVNEHRMMDQSRCRLQVRPPFVLSTTGRIDAMSTTSDARKRHC